MYDSLIDLALKSFSIREIVQLYETLMERNIRPIYVPEILERKISEIAKGKKYVVSLEGRYGSGKTAALVGSALMLEEAGAIENYFLNNASELINERQGGGNILRYDGYFIDEVERALIDIKGKNTYLLFGHVIREAFERGLPIFLVTKERGVLDDFVRISGGAIHYKNIIRVDFQASAIRREINEFLLDRNTKILELSYGYSFDRLKKEIMTERERFEIITPRAMNISTLSATPNMDFNDESIYKDLESIIRRFFKSSFENRIEKEIYVNGKRYRYTIDVVNDEKQGPDVTLFVNLSDGRTLTIGVEVKTSVSKVRVPRDQYKRHTGSCDGLLYIMFQERYDPSLIEKIGSRRIAVLQLPRKISYTAAAGGDESFASYMNAILTEREVLDTLLKNVISEIEGGETVRVVKGKRSKGTARRKRKASSLNVKEIIEILKEYGTKKIIKNKQERAKVSYSKLLKELASRGKLDNNASAESLKEELEKRFKEISKALTAQGFEVSLGSTFITIKQKRRFLGGVRDLYRLLYRVLHVLISVYSVLL